MKHWRYDENNFLTENGDRHDFLEVQYMAYMAYRKYEFIYAIKKCYLNESDIRPTRYPIPNKYDVDVSRDHIIYSICALKEEYGKSNYLDMYIKMIKPSKKLGFRMTLDLWLWLKLQQKKAIGKLWYPLIALYSFIHFVWNKTLNTFTRYDYEYHQDKYRNIPYEKGEKKFLNPISRIIFPVYALKLVATQLYHEENNFFTRIAKRNYLKITPMYNYVIQALLGSKIEQSDIDNYKPMKTARWAVILNPYVCQNEMAILEDEEYPLDKDYLKAIT